MRKHSILIPAAAVCLLPAVEIGPVTLLSADTGIQEPILASFIPACEVRPPHVAFTAATTMLPAPRPRDASIQVFLGGQTPRRPYEVIGELEVRGRNDRMNFRFLLEHAEREARRRGGEALVDVRPVVNASRGNAPMTVTAKVVTWI